MRSLLVENGDRGTQASPPADLLRVSGGGGGGAAAAAASGGPSLPFSAATDSGGGLNGAGMDGGGSAGGGGLFAASQGLGGGGSVQRRRERFWERERGPGRAGAGGDGAASACAGPAKNVSGWEAPVEEESSSCAKGQGGRGGVRRAWSCSKGVPWVAGAELDVAKGTCANAGGVAASLAITGTNGPGVDTETGSKSDCCDQATTKDAAAGPAPSATKQASGGEDKQGAAVGKHVSNVIGPVRRNRGGSGAVVTPPRCAAVEAPTPVSPPTRFSPPETSENSASTSTTKPASDEVSLSGAISAAAALTTSSLPRTPVAEQRDGGTATTEAEGTEVVDAGLKPPASGEGGCSALPPAVSDQGRLADGFPKTAPAGAVSAEAVSATEPPPPPADEDGLPDGATVEADSGSSLEQAMSKAAAAAAPGALPAVGVVPAPAPAPALAHGPLPAVGIVEAQGALPAAGVMPAPAPGLLPAVGIVEAPAPMPAVGAVNPPGPLPAVGVVEPPAPMPAAVGVVNTPGPMQAVGVLEAPGPGCRYYANQGQGPWQSVWPYPLRHPPTSASGGAYRPGGSGGGGLSDRNEAGVDEVSLRLAEISGALAMLEDVAILPRLYDVAASVQADVDRRDEVQAQNSMANRIERVRGYCGRVRSFLHPP